MRSRALPAVVLVLAVAALGATIAYAVDRVDRAGPAHRAGYSMMGASGQRAAWYLDGSGAVGDIAAARSRAQRFADRLGLRTGEVMQFADNFYVALEDRQGNPATEVLVDPRSGTVTLEYGAAMMWNTRYAMMAGATGAMMGDARGAMIDGRGSGMMGRAAGGMSAAGGSGPVDAGGARRIADRWLAAQRAGESAGEPDRFPGYFTIETRRDGRVAGMVSVNARTGALIYHWWHGAFVAAGQ